MNSTDPEVKKLYQRLYQLARQGNPKAIAMFLNRFKSSEDIPVIKEDLAKVQDNYLDLTVESDQFPLGYSSKKYIYESLKLLKLQDIKYVTVQPATQKNPKQPRKERIDLTTELEPPEPEPELSSFEKFQQNFKWPAWFPYPSSWLRMIVLILWIIVVIRIFAFWGVIIGGTVSVVSDDFMPLLQALGIGLISSILILSYAHHILSYIGRVLFGKSSRKSFQWMPTLLSLWEGIYTPIVLILSVLAVVLVIVPFIPWGNCQTELLFEDEDCYERIQNYGDSLEIMATLVWITSALYLYQIEYLIRAKVSAKKVIKFIALVLFSLMSTLVIYTTALNWDYVYGAFANIQTPFSISAAPSETLDSTENSELEPASLSKNPAEKPETVPPEIPDDSFRKGIQNATNASELVQAAKSKTEWEFVATQWQNAIDYMKQVQPDDPNYRAAQERVVQYQKNLEYARLAGSLAKE